MLKYICQSRFVQLVMLSISSIPEKLCLAENFIQKSDDSINNVASLTVNSVMDMFLQVLAKFSEQSCL